MANQELVLNDRYRLLAQQASGGMAVVYRAQDMKLMRTVAVKVLRPSLTGDPQFLTRFRQEAMNVANLSHPNIVTVHDFQQDGSTYYIVMEWIEGQDLKKIIRQAAPLPVERALKIAIQICAGIGYAHRARLVHADVKPQNILVTNEDVVKVTDFGIAQALLQSHPQQKADVVWGSPHYFAPEQAQGELPTPFSDVYSIGIVLFEMLTGKLPFSGNDQQELAMAHIKSEIPHVMDFNPRVPLNLDRIIYKVMSKNPNDRYANADALGRILESYKQQGQELTVDQPALKDPQRPANAGFVPAAQTFNQAGSRTPTGPMPPAAQGFTPTPATPQQSGNVPIPVRGNTPPPQPPVVVPNQPVQKAPNVPPTVPPAVSSGYTVPPAYAASPDQPQQFSGVYSVGNPSNPSVSNRGQQPPVPGSNYRPPQQPASPVYSSSSGSSQPYTPSTPYASAPDKNTGSGTPSYQLNVAPSPFSTVTIILAIIAAVLVIGLIPLGLIVLSRLG